MLQVVARHAGLQDRWSAGVGEGLPYIVPVWRAVASGGLLETNFSEQGQAVRVRMPECVRSLVHGPQVTGDKPQGEGV